MIGLCDRWGKTPEEILAMDARGIRLLNIYRQGHRDDEDAEGGE